MDIIDITVGPDIHDIRDIMDITEGHDIHDIHGMERSI
jgi:hypothetical protein